MMIKWPQSRHLEKAQIVMLNLNKMVVTLLYCTLKQ